MENLIKNSILERYIDWLYKFLFQYSDEKSISNKLKAIIMATMPIILAVGYIILIALYFIEGGM